jgi:hydroxypyruvate isomerase
MYFTPVPQFAANLGWLFTEHPFLDRFAAARAAGFDAVEFAVPYDHPPETIARRLADHQLQCILFNLPMGERSKGDIGIACRPGREAEFRDGVARALRYADALGCRRINCISGRIFAGEDRAPLLERLVSNLRFAAREFKAEAIELVVEPLNDIDNPDFILPRSPEMAGVIASVDEPNVGLQFDIYHTAMKDDDPRALIETLRPVIRHVQFADKPGRGEPGTGTIDIPPLFALLDRLGYDGWIGAEYRPTKRTEKTLDWMVR